MFAAVLFISALATGAASAQPAKGQDVKIYAAAVAKAPLTAIAAEYENATGNKVTLVFDTAGATEQRFRADPEAALLITTVPLIRNAESTGTHPDPDEVACGRAHMIEHGLQVLRGGGHAGLTIRGRSAVPAAIDSDDRMFAFQCLNLVLPHVDA
jgi:hypothetical protein